MIRRSGRIGTVAATILLAIGGVILASTGFFGGMLAWAVSLAGSVVVRDGLEMTAMVRLGIRLEKVLLLDLFLAALGSH